MRPFFFGASKAPLFGVHHPPKGPGRGQGVVLCPPFGQEYLRTHRALLQLAERLAALGFDVMRFDYFGCGDSAGEDREGRLDVWLQNTEAAIEEAEALCGSPRVGLVGVRLGAALAAQAWARRDSPGPLVLWDPVLDGPRYLEALRSDHEVWMRERARVRPATPRDPHQRLGFPLPEPLRAQIAALALRALAARVRSGALLVETDGGESPVASTTPLMEASLEVARVPGPPVWRRDEGDGMSASLVPLAAIDRIADWLGAQSR